MVPLEVTHTNQANEKVQACLAEFKSPLGVTLLELVNIYQQNYFKQYGFKFAPIHDPCAVFFVLEREHFEGRKVLYPIIAVQGNYRHLPHFQWSHELPVPIQARRKAELLRG